MKSMKHCIKYLQTTLLPNKFKWVEGSGEHVFVQKAQVTGFRPETHYPHAPQTPDRAATLSPWTLVQDTV